MKIAVTAAGPTLEGEVDPRFGRCRCFLFVETDDFTFEAVENPNVSLGGGAGIQSAQLLAGRGIRHVLTGNCGPNAYRTLSAAGIQVVTGCSGTVRQAVEAFLTGAFSAARQPNVAGHFGMGAGTGASGGLGSETGAFRVPSSPAEADAGEDEEVVLRQQINVLRQQLDQIQRRLDELQRRKEGLESTDRYMKKG